MMFRKRRKFSLKFYISIAGFSAWGILWILSIVEITNISSSTILLLQRRNLSDQITEHVFVTASQWRSRDVVLDKNETKRNEKDTDLQISYEESHRNYSAIRRVSSL